MSKILIIDDDQAVRDFLRQRFEGLHDVADTGNPEQALAMALEIKPDCILLDLMMPKFSGFELCQTFASLSYTQQIPILIVSGEPEAKYGALCKGLGAAGYFEKPVKFDELKARLAAVLNNKQKEHRTEVRVRLKVNLKLKGMDADGAGFEIETHTDNVSANGFCCSCKFQLKMGSVVAVSTIKDRETYVGKARVAWIDTHKTAWPLSGFRFVEKPREWVIG